MSRRLKVTLQLIRDAISEVRYRDFGAARTALQNAWAILRHGAER